MKKLFIWLSMAVIFVASALTVYFMYMNHAPVSDSEALAAGVRTVGYDERTLISSNTSIVKHIRYSKGVPVTVSTVEQSGPENLGMSRLPAEEYYKKSGFLVVEFNDKKVVLLKDVDKWPPNYYVAKEDKGIVNIYYTDDNGNLNFLKPSGLEIDVVPEEDQADLKKGIAFKTLQDIESMIEEYDS